MTTSSTSLTESDGNGNLRGKGSLSSYLVLNPAISMETDSTSDSENQSSHTSLELPTSCDYISNLHENRDTDYKIDCEMGQIGELQNDLAGRSVTPVNNFDESSNAEAFDSPSRTLKGPPRIKRTCKVHSIGAVFPSFSQHVKNYNIGTRHDLSNENVCLPSSLESDCLSHSYNKKLALERSGDRDFSRPPNSSSVFKATLKEGSNSSSRIWISLNRSKRQKVFMKSSARNKNPLQPVAKSCISSREYFATQGENLKSSTEFQHDCTDLFDPPRTINGIDHYPCKNQLSMNVDCIDKNGNMRRFNGGDHLRSKTVVTRAPRRALNLLSKWGSKRKVFSVSMTVSVLLFGIIALVKKAAIPSRPLNNKYQPQPSSFVAQDNQYLNISKLEVANDDGVTTQNVTNAGFEDSGSETNSKVETNIQHYPGPLNQELSDTPSLSPSLITTLMPTLLDNLNDNEVSLFFTGGAETGSVEDEMDDTHSYFETDRTNNGGQ